MIDGVLIIVGGAFLLAPGLHHGHRRPGAADTADAGGRSRRVLTRMIVRRGPLGWAARGRRTWRPAAAAAADRRSPTAYPRPRPSRRRTPELPPG